MDEGLQIKSIKYLNVESWFLFAPPPPPKFPAARLSGNSKLNQKRSARHNTFHKDVSVVDNAKKTLETVAYH